MAEALVRNARLREVGTRNLVAAAVAAGAKRMVAQSLAFVYAPGPMPYREDAPLCLDDPVFGETARAVASLEQQVLAAPLTGIVLRYGKLYGPGTGFDCQQAVARCTSMTLPMRRAERLRAEKLVFITLRRTMAPSPSIRRLTRWAGCPGSV